MSHYSYSPNYHASEGFREYLSLIENALRSLKNNGPEAPELRGKGHTSELLAKKDELLRYIEHCNRLSPLFHYLQNASKDEIEFDLRRFECTIADIPTASFNLDPELDKPVKEWRRHLETVVQEMKMALPKKDIMLTAAHQQVARVKASVQAFVDGVRLLEEQCEEDVRNHPNQEQAIRRHYRRAIDALKEGI